MHISELSQAALVVVRDCLAVQAHETLLVISDYSCTSLARALATAGRSFAREVLTLEYDPRKLDGQEPPSPVAQAMVAVDAVLVVTARSITYTAARRAATAAGARVATMPGVTEDCMVRAMNADYRCIAQRTRRAARHLTNAQEAHLTTPAGTDLVVPIGGIRAVASTGLVVDPGEWLELPSGEAYLALAGGTSEGVLVVDGSLKGIGKLQESVRITVKEGLAVDVEGGDEAHRFAELLAQVGASGRNVAKLGVGTNDRAKLTGRMLEDAKVLGTVHVALGSNASEREAGPMPFHLYGVVLTPTLTLDGETLVDAGTLLLE